MITHLVAGGAGILGWQLCDEFLPGSYHVICVCNHVTGRSTRIAHIRQPDAVFVQTSVLYGVGSGLR